MATDYLPKTGSYGPTLLPLDCKAADRGLADDGCAPFRAEMTPVELFVVAMFRPRGFGAALPDPYPRIPGRALLRTRSFKTAKRREKNVEGMVHY